MPMIMAHSADSVCVLNYKPHRSYYRRDGVKRDSPQERESFHFPFLARFFAFIAFVPGDISAVGLTLSISRSVSASDSGMSMLSPVRGTRSCFAGAEAPALALPRRESVVNGPSRHHHQSADSLYNRAC